MVVGLTGTNAAGKGEAANYLKKRAFRYFSCSDVLREGLAKQGIEPTRDNLIVYGNELRNKYGAGVLAKRLKLKIKSKSIVDSIRNVEEIKELRRLPHFVLIGVDAPVKLRFKRALKRNRLGDAATLKDFVAKEKRENTSDPKCQQLFKCLKEVDIKIINNGTVRELHNKIERILKNEQAKLG
ncbi:MAG: AAA family ATPase [Elusimicrobia bacterium]|nr:AAA family ATPase [Elusimicrobiota bacterium]MBU2615202.1 AAA family ATPase [Elusimicrobiota bacterium]